MNFTVKSTTARIFYLFVFSALLAHFFIAIGRNDALWGIFWQSFYYVELMYVGFIVFLISLLILWIWNKLDQWHPWQENFRKRILWQILAGVILPALCSIFMVHAYMSLILDQDIFQTSYFFYELPVSVVVIFMINLVLGIHFLTQSIPSATTHITSLSDPKPVWVQSGKSKILLDPDTICFVEKVGPVCMVYTDDKSRHVFPFALEELSKQILEENFFRANRQSILHRDNCKSFVTERSGKLILTMHLPEGKKISVSQKKSREFKFWLKNGATS